MFKSLLLFEWRVQTRQISFYLLLLLFSTISITSFVDVDRGVINGNSPYRLAFYISVLSIGVVFPVLLFAIRSLLKESEVQFEGILYSTSLSKFNYFTSRFLSVLSAALVIGTLPLLGFYLAQFFESSFYKTGEANITYLLWPWLVFVVPNVLILTSILFSTALFSKNAATTYASGCILFIFFWISSFFINSPLTSGQVLAGSEIVAPFAILDFFGLAAFFEQTQFWTTFEKNTLHFAFSGRLLFNRLLWTAVALAVTYLSYRKFSFRQANKKTRMVEVLEQLPALQPYKATKTSSAKFTKQFRAVQTQFYLASSSIIRSKGFTAVFLAWVVLLALGMYFMINGEGEFGSRIPTTDLLIGIVSEPFAVFGVLLTLFYSGELMWRGSGSKFSEIINSTPVSSASFFISNYLVILLLLFLMLSVGAGIGMIFQALLNHDFKDVLHYGALYYYTGLPVALLGIFALFIHVVVPNKFLAMITAGAIILFFSQAASVIGLEGFPLLRFLYFNRIDNQYSELSGYGQHAKSFHAFSIYWGALLGAISVIGIKSWNRGSQFTFREIRKALIKPFQSSEKYFLAGFVSIFLLSGSYIFFNLYVVSSNDSPEDEFWFNEQYERRFKQYESLPTPQITNVKTEVDIFPEELRYEVRGDYKITNTTEKPIHEIFISTWKTLDQLEIENAELVFHDKEMDCYLFKLEHPLKTQEQLSLTFELRESVQGFETSKEVMTNGSYISHQIFDPFLSYLDRLEIDDAMERSKRGLPEKNQVAYNDPHLPYEGRFTPEKVNYESVVSTSSNQTAITSGSLVKKWSENGRNYFYYKSAPKVRKNMIYFSANYESRQDNHNGVGIEMYYHPNHSHIIPLMLEMSKATLSYAITNFSPYQHDHLRIAEVSSGRGFGGQAMPGTISMAEKSMYTKDVSEPAKGINAVARRTIHEIAHQWWAHQLSPKQVAGGRVLTESLCKYTEAVVLEKIYGPAMIRRLTQYTTRSYFGQRARVDKEPPLYLVESQPYLGYSKGYLVFLALKDLLGEDSLNIALQQLLKQHANAATATSIDLINELYNVSPAVYHSLIDDWMKKVITYDLSVTEASYKKLPNGKYEVELDLESKRFEMTETGEEIEIKIHEPIKIGLFASHPNQMKKEETPVYLESHFLSSSQTKLKIVVDELPAYVSIDPYLTRIDKNSKDNLIRLEP